MKNPRILPTRMRVAKNSIFLATIILISLTSAAVIPSSLFSFLPVAAKEERRNAAAPTIESVRRNRTQVSSVKSAPTVPHVLPAAYYSLKGNLSSTLTLNNKGPHPLEIQPTLFSLNGHRLDVPPVIVEGTSFRVINLRDWAMPAAGFDEGSLQVLHYGMDMQLGAQVKMIDADRGLIFAEQMMANMAMSSRLEGVWWLRSHGCQLRLVVSNTSDSPLTVSVSIEGISPSQHGPSIINLASHETRVINPERLAANEKGTLRKLGGFSLSHDGPAGALLAHGFIEEAATGFSSSIEFSNPSMAHSSKLNGGGLRLGRLTGQELTPVVVARNIGTTESIISGSLPFTLDDGTASSVSVPEIRLRPGEVNTLDLSRAIRRSRINLERVVSAGLEFTYSSAPGSVLMSAQSVSSDGEQVFRLPLIDAEAEPSSTGGYPWRIDENSSTFVYITNVTDRPQHFALELNFDHGVYAPGLKTIAPKQTAVLDIRALRDGQVADEHGNTIPVNQSSGQVNWSVIGGENLVLIGRAEQADLVSGMSSSYACVNCCPSSCAGTWVDPGSVIGFPGDTQLFAPVQQNEDCFGNSLTPFNVSAATWNSSNTAVATVDSSGFGTAQGVGTTNIGANWSAWLWDMNPNNTCTKTRIFPSPAALCDVFLPAVSFQTAVLGNKTMDFGGLPRPIATFNGRDVGLPICGNLGQRFDLTVKFTLPAEAIAVSQARSSAKGLGGTNDADFGVDGFEFENVDLTSTPKKGEMVIRAFTRSSLPTEPPFNAILIRVAGDYGTGTFIGEATVKINCQ